MSTRNHRPALVEAQDLKGAPRGRYSSKLYQEYYCQAKEKNDEDMKVVAISKASELQDDLLDKINNQDFKDLFGSWDPKAECEEYLTGPTGGKYKRGKDIPVTPTPDPEMQVDPPAKVPPLHQGRSQQYQQGSPKRVSTSTQRVPTTLNW
ncbi:uncharacterized protein PGTG_21848 [Puccinia graminis f. sp. tritici CRL 75-36-700-3]|uniref:Uncharacterized protein n=1 Tax=Puccinia graminis f. sp. tritici (strain CRL 75-36-700-3 / race SCCL) TaxID=418459 RepID=H6QSK5_PUCGT|nr:uncharacterized protein PGTG_21848 [Puccinia graminis f. sp. tritici CRL 75-36-700-3]EHS63756.1 hypothetical protein PGTG_21848 [Puccinia graminis f. sp. tritici CRL 75-36-700-3]